MSGRIRIKPFKRLRDLKHFCHAGLGRGGFLEARLQLDGLFQAHRRRRILRHQLGQLVDLAERQFEDAAGIAHDAARQKRSESDDLRDFIVAVASPDIGNHFVAPLLTEIDIEIRHRNAFRIEEALEQETEADRIEIGNRKRIGNQGPGPRPASRPDRNIPRFGVFDEIRDDQKIAGEIHLDDHVEFEGKPCVIISGREAGRRAMRGKTRRQSSRRLGAEFLRLGFDPAIHGKTRQNRFAGQRPVGATQRDLDAVAGCLRKVGEKRDHFRARLETMLGRKLAAARRR